MQRIKRYFWNLLISLDQLVNTVFGGDADETISSRMGKWARDGEHNRGLRKPIFIIVNFIVERFERNHFQKSIEEDEGKNSTLK